MSVAPIQRARVEEFLQRRIDPQLLDRANVHPQCRHVEHGFQHLPGRLVFQVEEAHRQIRPEIVVCQLRVGTESGHFLVNSAPLVVHFLPLRKDFFHEELLVSIRQNRRDLLRVPRALAYLIV